MLWTDDLRGNPLSWLLKTDDPGPRYLALSRVLEADDAELKRARRKAHREGPIAAVLDHMEAEGYWVKSGPGYNPKYRSTVWAMILLAQLGARVTEDKRLAKACDYMLDQMCEDGQFTAITSGTPAGTIDCLQGNLCWSLAELGCEDPRLDKAFGWMARTVTGEGMGKVGDRESGLRYYSYKCGPLFACGVNNRLPCAWGGVKVMLAFSRLPVEKRTPLIQRAIAQGTDFFFGIDPVTARYPTRLGDKPNRAWWKFGFPVFYVTDLLQLAAALTALGFADDPRLAGVLELIRSKQDERGRWPLEYDYPGKTWLDFGTKREPNKWVTLRALEVLKGA